MNARARSGANPTESPLELLIASLRQLEYPLPATTAEIEAAIERAKQKVATAKADADAGIKSLAEQMEVEPTTLGPAEQLELIWLYWAIGLLDPRGMPGTIFPVIIKAHRHLQKLTTPIEQE